MVLDRGRRENLHASVHSPTTSSAVRRATSSPTKRQRGNNRKPILQRLVLRKQVFSASPSHYLRVRHERSASAVRNSQLEATYAEQSAELASELSACSAAERAPERPEARELESPRARKPESPKTRELKPVRGRHAPLGRLLPAASPTLSGRTTSADGARPRAAARRRARRTGGCSPRGRTPRRAPQQLQPVRG